MRVEYLEAPLGIDDPAPRMSWAPISAARGAAMASFRIVVASGGATVWDSGVVVSNSSVNVAYAGPAPASDTDYTWTLTWTDATGASATGASATGTSATGASATGASATGAAATVAAAPTSRE